VAQTFFSEQIEVESNSLQRKNVHTIVNSAFILNQTKKATVERKSGLLWQL
jgi:hypothetical protein